MLLTEYKKNINRITKIFFGNIKEIRNDLIKDIKYFSKNENYEKALELKKRLDAYEYVVQKRLNINEFLKIQI